MSNSLKDAFLNLGSALGHCQENSRSIVDALKRGCSDLAENAEGGGGGSSQDYSTEEHVIGKWIDGTTDVYEKVITSASVGTGASSIAHGITGINTVVSLYGTCVFSSKALTLPYVSSSTYAISIGNVDSTNIEIDVGSSLSGGVSNIILVIRYTKTA